MNQDDLENAVKKYGIEADTFGYQFDGIQEDDYLYRHFKSVLQKKDYDAVISWNFWPVVAQVCYDLGISYLAWVYDCPISYEIMPWAGYETSYVYIFDKAEYELYKSRGVKNIFHLPLAVDTDRIDNIVLSDEDVSEYTHDVSFLGTMYDSIYDTVSSLFTETERIFVEDQIEAQGFTYKNPILWDLVESEDIEYIRQKWQASGTVDAPSPEIFRFWLIQILVKERTRRDRISLLNDIGAVCDTVYYSYESYPEIVNASYHSHLEYNNQMFKMFRASRINLNPSYRMITRGIPLRALDIMAAGGFLLSNYQEELVENFKPGVDFACFDNADEAKDMIKYYLEHEDERIKIAKNGHEAVKKFDYDIQFNKLIDQYLNSKSSK